MAIEIERKFLLRDDSWRTEVERAERMRQGYLVIDAVRSVRIRVAGAIAHLNIKSATKGISRDEYEYAIPIAEAEQMLDTLCAEPLIEKTRYWVNHQGHVWEIDEFAGANADLIVAEIELSDPGETFVMPTWVGQEVTDDLRYYNAALARNPYQNWRS